MTGSVDGNDDREGSEVELAASLMAFLLISAVRLALCCLTGRVTRLRGNCDGGNISHSASAGDA